MDLLLPWECRQVYTLNAVINGGSIVDLGLNLYTHHYHQVCENQNRGIYVVHESTLIGILKNSACRSSVNIGYNVYDKANLTLTIGGLTGYPGKRFKPYVIPSYKYRNLRISVLGKEGVHFSLEFPIGSQ